MSVTGEETKVCVKDGMNMTGVNRVGKDNISNHTKNGTHTHTLIQCITLPFEESSYGPYDDEVEQPT